jgi:hypothetical protein
MAAGYVTSEPEESVPTIASPMARRSWGTRLVGQNLGPVAAVQGAVLDGFGDVFYGDILFCG